MERFEHEAILNVQTDRELAPTLNEPTQVI